MPSKRDGALGSPSRTVGNVRHSGVNGHASHSLRDAHHGQNPRVPAIHYSPAASPRLANGADRDFPPTPPSYSRESMARPPKHAPNGNAVNSAKPLPMRSSKDHRSPPTPETTPPASLSPPQRQIPSRLSSSAAESFQTAREDPWESNDNISSIEDTVRNDLRRPASQLSHLGLGFENDVDRTPRQSVENLQHAVTDATSSPTRTPMDHIPNREWDTNLMRNVTIRRKKAPNTEVLTNGITTHSTDKPSPPTVRSSLDSPRTPDAAAQIRRNLLRRVSPESNLEDYGSRRHSTISNSSTVIEAIIVTTPPQQPRKLRHVSKASSLRSEVDANSFESPGISSARDSLESTEMPARRLPKTRLSISDGRMQPLTPVRDRRIRVTDPLLRHQKDTTSLRTDAQRPVGASRSRVASQSVDETSRNTPGSYHRRGVSDMPGLISPTKRINESPSKRINYESESSSDAPFPNRVPQLAQRTEPSRNQSSFIATRQATQRALENVLGPAFSPKSSDNESLVTVIRKRSGASIDRANGMSADDDRLLRPMSNRRASDAGSGRSIDREFSTRLSIDRATLRSEDHPRHLYSQTTPFSQISDVPEVSEATAVTIHPHNNHSLLVVQQPKLARPVEEEVEQQHNAPPPDQPLLTFQPSTPPRKPAEPVVNSPLTNPRNAPLPPIINVLPATPAHDESDARDGAADGLQRRPSLLERARRYSDNIIQPIIKRSTSLRRRNSQRSPARRASAERLHPNWRPRDFWDDNSDSESDFGDGAAGDGLAARDALPPGGDTSEPPPEPLPRRLTQRLPGFRGTGGFLIGNSLGVERHGTNRRRPHVTLPANFLSQRRQPSGSGGTAITGSTAVGPADDAHRVRKKQSLGSLRSASARQQQQQRQAARRRWRTMSLRIEYVGIGGLRERWRARQLRAHERRAEKRREEIRRSIGPKFLVQNGAV